MNIKINDSSFINTTTYKNFVNKNTGIGKLHINASFAEQALPIPNLKIKVLKEIDNYNVIFYEGQTNSSGKTEAISLPTLPKEQNDLDTPTPTKYKIVATYNNKEYNYIVNMYDEICSIQNINIVYGDN